MRSVLHTPVVFMKWNTTLHAINKQNKGKVIKNSSVDFKAFVASGEMQSNTLIVTTIEDIPPEILVSKILFYLSSPQRQNLRAVSQSWRQIIDKFFGQRLHITNKNWEWLSSSTDIVDARFTNWTRDFFPDLNFCDRIRTLEIFSPTTPISYYSILPVLKSCGNIINLVLGNIVGAYVKDFEKDVDFSLEEWLQKERNVVEKENDDDKWFPNLDSFKFIDDFKTKANSLGSYAQGCCHRKDEFISFIFKKLAKTKLKTIEVKLNNSFWWVPLCDIFQLELEMDFSSAQRDADFDLFNERRYKTFVQLPIRYLGQRRINLEYLLIQYHNFITIECVFHKRNFSIGGIRQLQGFKSSVNRKAMTGRSGRMILLQGQEIHNLWSEVLKTQFTLRDFDAQLTFDSADHLLPVLRNNAGTLEHTSIITTIGESDEDDAEEWGSFDFRRFQQRTKQQTLTHLSFIVDDQQQNVVASVDDNHKIYIHPLFQQIKSLPDSLVKLEISCPLDLSPEETSEEPFRCLKHLVNLKELELWNRSRNDDNVLMHDGNGRRSSHIPVAWFMIGQWSILKLNKSHIESIIKNLPELSSLKFHLGKNVKDCCSCERRGCICCNSESSAWGKLNCQNFNDNFDQDVLGMRSIEYGNEWKGKVVSKDIRIIVEMDDANEGQIMKLKCLSVLLR